MEILLVVIVFIFIVKVKKIFSSLFVYINLNIINYIIYSLTGYEILVKSYTLTDPPIYRSEATLEVVKDITEKDFQVFTKHRSISCPWSAGRSL